MNLSEYSDRHVRVSDRVSEPNVSDVNWRTQARSPIWRTRMLSAKLAIRRRNPETIKRGFRLINNNYQVSVLSE